PRGRGAGDHPRQTRRHQRGDGLVARRPRAGLRDRQLHVPAHGPWGHLQAARQRMAKARGLALLAALLLAGCGGSLEPAPKRVTLRVAAPLVPRQLDPAKASDLPSLNVAHELYAGLTRFGGTGVGPDLAESWDVDEGGLVWTFHLRKNLRWSDETPIVAEDFRRSWRQALPPSTQRPYPR